MITGEVQYWAHREALGIRWEVRPSPWGRKVAGIVHWLRRRKLSREQVS